MTEQEWLEARKKCLTGTDIAKIFQMAPASYGSPISVWLEKTGRMDTPQMGNERMEIGRLIEDSIRKIYCKRTGREVEHVPFTLHPRYPWMGGTPDDLIVGESRGVDYKNVDLGEKHHWGDPHTDQVPRWIALQAIQYMMVFDRDIWDIAVLFGGSKFCIYTLQRDMALERKVLKYATKWWYSYVVGNSTPPVDSSEGYLAYLKTLYPESTGERINAGEDGNEEIEYWGHRTARIRRLIAKLKDEEQRSINELLSRTKESEGAYGTDWNFSFKANKNGVKTFRFKS